MFAPLFLYASTLGAAHQHATPAVRGRISDGAKERLFPLRVERAGTKRQGWFESEALGMIQPGGVILERGAFPPSVDAGP